jgi:hypothetical protein
MLLLELFAYLDQKSAQPLHRAGDHTGLASRHSPYQSTLLSPPQKILLPFYAHHVHNDWIHGIPYLLWRSD